MKKLILALAATAMTASPVLAANPAAKLSVAPQAARASAKEGDSKLFGGSFIITALVAAAVIAAIIIIADDNSDSP